MTRSPVIPSVDLYTDSVRCEEACRVAYHAARGWEAGVIHGCSLELPVNPEDDARVSCTGLGFEYMCEPH
jgi:hypothetical protein